MIMLLQDHPVAAAPAPTMKRKKMRTQEITTFVTVQASHLVFMPKLGITDRVTKP